MAGVNGCLGSTDRPVTSRYLNVHWPYSNGVPIHWYPLVVSSDSLVLHLVMSHTRALSLTTPLLVYSRIVQRPDPPHGHSLLLSYSLVGALLWLSCGSHLIHVLPAPLCFCFLQSSHCLFVCFFGKSVLLLLHPSSEPPKRTD